MQYQQYLVNNVLPFVAEGLIRIAREKPIDPITFLSEFLAIRGNEIENQAIEEARIQFQEELKLAEEIDNKMLHQFEKK